MNPTKTYISENDFTLETWKDIKDGFNGTILLGNGASISVDNRFNYGSLKQYLIERNLLTSDVEKIFDFFQTDDFERILRILWQVNNVNKALEIDDKKTESLLHKSEEFAHFNCSLYSSRI